MATNFLVTGDMRSGTTFLANLLNSQKGIICYADFLGSLFRDAPKMEIKNIYQQLSERQKKCFKIKLNC